MIRRASPLMLPFVLLPFVLLPFVLLPFVLTGCDSATKPDRWQAADEATREGGVAQPQKDGAGDMVSGNSQSLPADRSEVVAGGDFNKYFPKVESPWDIIYKQEKQGFAQANLNRDGTEVAVLSINDTASNPAAAEKYRSATAKIDGYPSAANGSLGTGVLVDDRFQVLIRSAPEKGLSMAERQDWIRKFDLIGLEALR